MTPGFSFSWENGGGREEIISLVRQNCLHLRGRKVLFLLSCTESFFRRSLYCSDVSRRTDYSNPNKCLFVRLTEGTLQRMWGYWLRRVSFSMEANVSLSVDYITVQVLTRGLDKDFTTHEMWEQKRGASKDFRRSAHGRPTQQLDSWWLEDILRVSIDLGRHGCTDSREIDERKLKNPELINHDNKDRAGPWRQKWTDGEIIRERPLPFL